MNADLKNRLYFIAAAILIIGGAVGGWFVFKDTPDYKDSSVLQGEPAETANNGDLGDEVLGVESEDTLLDVGLTLDYGTGAKDAFDETVDEGTTAAGLLGKVAQANGITVTYQQYDFGRMVTAIGGKAADASHYWAFYVNGAMAEVGADSYVLKEGDQIEFVYSQM